MGIKWWLGRARIGPPASPSGGGTSRHSSGPPHSKSCCIGLANALLDGEAAPQVEVARHVATRREHQAGIFSPLGVLGNGDPPDVLISPRLGSIGWFDFHRASDVIAIGARAAERALEPIADAIASLSAPALPNAAVK